MARTKHRRQKFAVNVSLQGWDIAKAGAAVGFDIKNPNGGRLGRLEVGQGSLRWKPAYAIRPIRIPWHRVTDRLVKQK
jgi:hypothetical protein